MDNTPHSYTPITAIRSIEDAEAFRDSVRRFARENWPAWQAEMRPRNCPFCGLDDATPAAPFAESFEVSRCRSCNSLYVNPAPTPEQLERFYRDAEPIRILNQIYARRDGRAASFVNDTRMNKVLSCLESGRPEPGRGSSVLEVGCNNGRFLQSLKAHAGERSLPIEQLVGLDVDASVLPSEAQKDIEYRALSLDRAAQLEEFRERFDVVCHFELVEHLPDPFEFMQQAQEVLCPGGFMVFTTPNAAGMEMKAAGYNDYRLLSHAIFPPMHLNAFSVHNVVLFAVRAGYRVLATETPGRLDVDCAMRYAEAGSTREPVFEHLRSLDDGTLGLVQALVARLQASSTLLVVLQKPDRA